MVAQQGVEPLWILAELGERVGRERVERVVGGANSVNGPSPASSVRQVGFVDQ